MPRDIAIDEQTALLVDGSGNATVVGISTVYFMQAPGAPELCQAKTPLVVLSVPCFSDRH
jgi:cyanophycinase-like exopeptidase